MQVHRMAGQVSGRPGDQTSERLDVGALGCIVLTMATTTQTLSDSPSPAPVVVAEVVESGSELAPLASGGALVPRGLPEGLREELAGAASEGVRRVLEERDRASDHSGASTFGELAESWIESKRSTHTRAAYRAEVKRWADFCASEGTEPEQANRRLAQRYLEAMNEAGRSPKSVRCSIAALGSLASYARDLGSPLAPQVWRKLPLPVVAVDPAVKSLTEADAAVLLAGARAARESGERDALMIRTALELGLRVSELVGFLASRPARPLRSHGAYIARQAEDGSGVVVVVGKGSKRREVPLAPSLGSALRAYAAERPEGDLFATSSGRRLSRQAFAKRLGLAAKRAGLARPVAPHDLRHTFAVRCVDLGVAVVRLSRWLGHSSTATTAIYYRGASVGVSPFA